MIDTARQRRAQQVEAKYAADLRRLRQAKEDDLQELNERFKVLKNAYNMERIRIKEDFELRRLNLKTQIHALSIDADTTGMGDLDDFTMRINNLQVELIGIDSRRFAALNNAEAKFNNRCKEIAEERRAINKHYINEAERLHDAYLQHVEQNRQERESEEGGAES